MIKNIKGMSLHDRSVYRVAKNLLEEGSESVEIGNRANDAISICSKLKTKFPNAQIFTYLGDSKVEFISPTKINLGG